MKKIIIAVLILVMLTPQIMITRSQIAPLPEFANFELMYQNQYAGLFINEHTNTIRVFQRDSGAYFDTLVTDGTGGNAFTRNVQRSDFDIGLFRDTFLGTRMNMNSFADSVDANQHTITAIDQGIRVEFKLGDPDRIVLPMFPMYISRERMEYFVLQHMDQQSRDEFSVYYRFSGGRFVRQWSTFDRATGDPTLAPIPRLRALHRYFYEFGTYSIEELHYDNEYWEYEHPFEPPPLVYLVIEYTLCGPDLVISVPRDGFDYLSHQPFASIIMHPYFLSAPEGSEGYIFIPDGSGGIIRFDNGETLQEAVLPVFGADPLFNNFMFTEFHEQATLPIFGIVHDGTGVLAIIEEGGPVATIMANTSGRIDEFNRVYARFDLMYHEAMLMRGGNVAASSNMFLDGVYDMTIRTRYIFLAGEDASYVGMARAYQQYLLARGGLNTNPIPQQAPLFVDFIASTPRSRVFLGFSYIEHYAMTTTTQAESILQSLMDMGITDINAQFSHWANGGQFTTRLDNIRPLRSIGGNRGMRNLENFTAETAVSLFPSAQTATIREMPGRLWGATTRGMMARGITNNFVGNIWQEPHTRMNAGWFPMISPVHWEGYANRVNQNFVNAGFNNIAVTDMGNLLFGDYGRRNTTTRLEAVAYAENALNIIGNDLNVMLVNPNAYAFAFANAITDLPFRNGGRRIVDFNIPFVQMVLENHIPFSMPAYNIDSMAWRGFDEYLLRAVESRSAMKLNLTYQNERDFWPSIHNFGFNVLPGVFFQTDFDHWQSRIAHYHAQFNAFYQAVLGATITSHEVLDAVGQHVRVGYSNGVVVYINYANTPWLINGRTINPLSFILEA